MTSMATEEGWEPRTHQLIDGEWVMTYSSPDGGGIVDADGNAVDLAGAWVPEQYLRTVVIDGRRFHERVSADGDGSTRWYDESGNPQSVDPADADLLPRPGEIYVHEGELYRVHTTELGVDIVLDATGAEADVSPHQLGDELDLPDFAGFAQYGDLRAVVGIDGDGETRLYTVQGDLIDRAIPWDDVDRIDPGPLTGDPVAIGDYAMEDGATERVYLFPDGSQATRQPDGSYERVIVPTEIEYPRGHPFFEGNIETGGDGIASAPMEVFSFADGQTAYRIDGELVLLDLPLNDTHPGAAPVDCGPFPGGDLLVFPDGRQLIQRLDGTWALGDLPDLPPFEELAVTFGELDVDSGSVESPTDLLPDAPADDLFDDITGIGGTIVEGGIAPVVDREPGPDTSVGSPLDAVDGGVIDGGVIDGGEPPLPDLDLGWEPPSLLADDSDVPLADDDVAADDGLLD